MRKVYDMTKRMIPLAAALVLGAVVLTGCGNKGTGDAAPLADTAQSAQESAGTESTVSAAKADVSPQELYDHIAGAVSLPDMYMADDDFIMNYYGIDASLLDSYVFASAEDSTRVDSVILMKVKDEGSIPEIEKGLNGLISQMEVEMDNYQPDAYKLVSKSAVKTTGDYVYLVISADEEAINAVIDEKLK